jgi:hypothetical protein
MNESIRGLVNLGIFHAGTKCRNGLFAASLGSEDWRGEERNF